VAIRITDLDTDPYHDTGKACLGRGALVIILYCTYCVRMRSITCVPLVKIHELMSPIFAAIFPICPRTSFFLLCLTRNVSSRVFCESHLQVSSCGRIMMSVNSIRNCFFYVIP